MKTVDCQGRNKAFLSAVLYFLGSSAKTVVGHRACQKHMMLNVSFPQIKEVTRPMTQQVKALAIKHADLCLSPGPYL